MNLEEVQTKLGYRFSDTALLESALTHPSLSSGKNGKKAVSSAYERLEFLGDRVLGLVIAAWLYRLFPGSAEGDLAKRHASLVNRDALRRVAEAAGIEKHLLMAHGPDAGAERQNLAALSDAVESVIGALYLDGGLEPAEKFIKRFWEDSIHVETAPADPKSALQEWAQGRGLPLPDYEVVKRAGPAHAPVFTVQVSVKGRAPVICEGNSKREAEKQAAETMLREIEGR